MPPELMQLLQGGGDPAAAGPMPSGPMPSGPMQGPGPAPADPIAALLGGGAPPAGPEGAPAGPPSITDGSPGGGEESIVIALDALQDAIDAESDQEDISVLLQCQANLQKILAKNQSEADSMMQGKASPRGIRRATA